jgi:hypothetical protein
MIIFSIRCKKLKTKMRGDGKPAPRLYNPVILSGTVHTAKAKGL